MKHITYFFLLLFLCACAGNPPEWWNPSGRYNSAPKTVPLPAPAVAPATLPQQRPASLAEAEETFTPQEADFEEMDLEPTSNESLEGAVDALQPSVLED